MNNQKRELLNAYRDQLSKTGYERADAKTEVEACKTAIRKRRVAAKDQQTVEHRDALIDEIYEEISSPRARRATRAREDEAASLSAASSSESQEGGANPDLQGRLSGIGSANGRSEGSDEGRHHSVAPTLGATPEALASDPEKPPMSVPAENAMNVREQYAVGPQTDRSDPGPIPACLRRTAPETQATLLS